MVEVGMSKEDGVGNTAVKTVEQLLDFTLSVKTGVHQQADILSGDQITVLGEKVAGKKFNVHNNLAKLQKKC